MRDWGAEGDFTPATDVVYVRSIHAESAASLLTIKGSTAEGAVARVDVRSVVGDTSGTTPGNLATGASVTASTSNDIIIAESIYIYGVAFDAGDDMFISDPTLDNDIELESCTLALETSASAADRWLFGDTSTMGSHIRLKDCTFTPGDAGNGTLITNCRVIFEGCTWSSTLTDFLKFFDAEPSDIILRACDLSNIQGNLVSAAEPSHHVSISFQRCELHTSASFVTGTIDVPGVRVEFIHCQVGTDSDPAFQTAIYTKRGLVAVDTARYRTGGASDGERTNPVSWDMDTTVGSVRSYPGHPLESPAIVGWTDGDASTAHTYRIYFASGGTQQDDDIWFELIGPNDAATNSLGVRNTARVAPETAAGNHTTDAASTWNGADVTTKQQMDISYTPDKPGPISVIVYMATDAGSTGHIFVDPKIYIDP